MESWRAEAVSMDPGGEVKPSQGLTSACGSLGGSCKTSSSSSASPAFQLEQEPIHVLQHAALACKASSSSLHAGGLRDAGRLVALAGVDATLKRYRHDGDLQDQMHRHDRSRKAIGRSLLPGRYKQECTYGTSLALFWQSAATPINILQMGPESPEEPRFRVLVTQTKPSLLLLELNAMATFNMMDADAAADANFAMDACNQLLKLPKSLKGAPLAYVLQGSGPHFCPGGNPNPDYAAGHTAFSTIQYTQYACFVRCRELGIPGVCALTGSMVGGGVAYSLNTTMRLGTKELTVCFGNLSRGAVPGMVLSTNLPQALGLAGAMDLYLTDGTLSAYGALKAGFLHGMQGGNQLVKQAALRAARNLAETPLSSRLAGLRPPLDMERYATESWAIDLSAKSGALFQNIGAQAVPRGVTRAAENPTVDEEQSSTVHPAALAYQSQRQEARPKRRAKRRIRRHMTAVVHGLVGEGLAAG
eukprot:TRINITY_DN65484_c0_g1_i1.p1 TRINITY_DN65484_c0_g1~~TRINITY_DN65484_c0_g1_i1.p1  ORF type:complete len:474 (-),score=93.80 TRINITY_DN65484_c0_g1_i1:349-1770(-)